MHKGESAVASESGQRGSSSEGINNSRKHHHAFLSLRQLSVFKQVVSFNLIRTYVPWACVLSVAVYVSWLAYWIVSSPQARSHQIKTSGQCDTVNMGYSYGITPHEDQCTCDPNCKPLETETDGTKQIIAGLNFATFIIHAIYMVTFLNRYRPYLSHIATETHRAIFMYGAVIHVVATLTHLLVSFSDSLPFEVHSYFFPTKTVNVVILGKWLSLAPLIMVATLSLNVRSAGDLSRFYQGVAMQTISLITGVASFVTDGEVLSWVLLTISCVTFLDIFLVLHHKYMHWTKAEPLLKKIQVKSCSIFHRDECVMRC
jgi:hypothetical protein